MTVQKDNAAMADLLSAHFPRRKEPNFALANLLPTFQMLPGLRGLWPMSSIFEDGRAMDFSYQTRHLTNNGSITTGGTWGLVPYSALNGTNQWWSRADEAGLDITGSLTVGLWFDPTALDGSFRGMITKCDLAANQSFFLAANNTGIRFQVDQTGSGVTSIANAAAPALNNWNFVVGRFTAGTEIALFLNGVWSKNTVGIVPSIYNSNTALEIGRLGLTNARCLGMWAAVTFVCAAAPSDAVIMNLWQQSKAAFGQ